MMTDPINTRPAHLHAGLFIHDTSRPLLSIAGEDRISYLQGLLSQDVASQSEGTVRYSFFLNPKARILFDSWTAARPGEILLSPSGASEADFVSHLKKYLFFRTRATITSLTAAYRSLTLVGREAPSLAMPLFSAEPGGDGFRSLTSGGLAFLRPHQFAYDRDIGPWIDLWIPEDRFEETLAALEERIISAGGMRLDTCGMEIYRLEQGIPLPPTELNEGHFPAEAGLDSLAVSYNKGCYVGQEPVTRLKFQGQLSRKLVGLRSQKETLSDLSCPRNLFSTIDGADAGVLTSLAFSQAAGTTLGLGYVKRNHWDPGTVLIDGVGQKFDLSDFPFYSAD